MKTKSLQLLLHKQFSANSRQRGFSYFSSRALSSFLKTDDCVRAKIHGSSGSSYRVIVGWAHLGSLRELDVACTCPYFNQGHMCKHLWAVILEMDRRNVSMPFPLGSGTELNPMHTRGERAFYETSGAAESKSHPSSSGRDWRSALTFALKPGAQTKATSSSSNPTPPQIYFVIEPGRTPTGETVKIRFFKAHPNAQGKASDLSPFHYDQGESPSWSQPDATTLVRTLLRLATNHEHVVDLDDEAEEDYPSHTHRYQDDRYRRMHVPHTPTMDTTSCELPADLLKPVLGPLLAAGPAYPSLTLLQEALASGHHKGLTLWNQPKFKAEVVQIKKQGYLLRGTVEDEKDSFSFSQLEKLAEPNLFTQGRKIFFIDPNDAERIWMEELWRHRDGITVPRDESEAFLEAVLNQSLTISLPRTLQWREVWVKPAPSVDLQLSEEFPDQYVLGMKFQYGSRTVSDTDPRAILASQDEKKIFFRDNTAEQNALASLPMENVTVRAKDENTLGTVKAKDLIPFVKSVLSQGLPIEIERKKIQKDGDFKMSVLSGVDWFDLEGATEFSGLWVKIPALLESLAKGERFVPLKDGSLGFLSDDLAKRLENLAAFGTLSEESLRFSRSQSLMLNALLENETNVKLDAKFRAIRRKIRAFDGIKPLAPPDTFQGKLRHYQKEGLGWLEFLESFGLGGILADDMGLGKTVQCLAFLEARRLQHSRARMRKPRTPSLVVAPKSLLQNWAREAAKFSPDLKTLIHAGLERSLDRQLFAEHDLIITTYQTLLRDLEEFQNIPWDCVLLDEAQAVKNPEALTAKAVKTLPSKFRLAMTGTPIENSVQDLFSISEFVNPGFLNGKKSSAHLKLNDDTKKSLAQAFRPVLLRRTKEQVLRDLPKKTEQTLFVDLEARQARQYASLKKFYQQRIMQDIQANGLQKSRFQVLAALTRLRQAALHSGLIDKSQQSVKSAKIEALLERLPSILAEGHRVLVFSQFTSFLALLQTELKRNGFPYAYLDGKTTQRHRVVEGFKSSNTPIFLMSLKAGGVGLNLVEADFVFLLDPWWNPAVEAQAIDRVHRIGQKRPVVAYRFITRNTVEEKILELQKTKLALTKDLLDSDTSLVRGLTAQDIEMLLN